jgi:hypothetical protein
MATSNEMCSSPSATEKCGLLTQRFSLGYIVGRRWRRENDEFLNRGKKNE